MTLRARFTRVRQGELELGPIGLIMIAAIAIETRLFSLWSVPIHLVFRIPYTTILTITICNYYFIRRGTILFFYIGEVLKNCGKKQERNSESRCI